jgi:hypothetical protein
LKKRPEPEILGAAPTLIHGKLIQGILCRQAITMAVADLLENDRAFSVENERRWVSRFMGRIPTQSIEIGDLIVTVGYKKILEGNSGCFSRNSFACRPTGGQGYTKSTLVFFALKSGGVICEIMNLLNAVGARSAKS